MAAVMEARPGATEKLVKDGKVSVYQPEQEGLIFPELPVSGRIFSERGNLTVRAWARIRSTEPGSIVSSCER